PTINSSLIYYSLFSEESYSSVFDQMSGIQDDFETPTNTYNLAFFPSKLLKIPVSVKNTSLPMTIGDKSIIYFWEKFFSSC
ncbi:hypothetical protein PENTCL1PPCAC_1939, partial [Pristionchus entomophagus]